MNKRTLFLAAFATASGVLSLSAQSKVLIYGWDFSDLTAPAVVELGPDTGWDFQVDPVYPSNHSIIGRTANIYFNSFGSSNPNTDVFNLPDVTTFDGTDTVNTNYNGNPIWAEDFSTDTTDPEALAFDSNASSFTIRMSTLGIDSLELSAAVLAGTQAPDVVTFDFSLNGTDFSNITGFGSTWVIGTSYAAYNLNISGVGGLGYTNLDNQADVYLRVNFAGGSAVTSNPQSFIAFDNLQVIPEPATYAVAFGALAVLIAVWRKSRR